MMQVQAMIKTEAKLKDTEKELFRFIKRMRRMGALDYEINIEAADGMRIIRSQPSRQQHHTSALYEQRK